MSRAIEHIQAERDQIVKAMSEAVGSGFHPSKHTILALKSLNSSIERYRLNDNLVHVGGGVMGHG